MAKNKAQQSATVTKPRKPAGTRMGTMEDWRMGGTRKFREKNARGKTLRDGR